MNALAAALAVGLGTGSPVTAGALWLALLGAPALGRRLGDAGWGAVTLAVLGTAGLGVYAGWTVESALLGILGWLLVHRRLVGPRRDRVAALVTGLILVATATLTSSGVFGVAVLAWLIGLPGALGPASGRARLALVGAVGLVAAVGFWSLPRWGEPLVTVGTGDGHLTGFSDEVELGAMDVLLDDPARVFEARFSELPADPPYWRGIALDRFDGRRWTIDESRSREADWITPRPDLVRVEIALEAHPEGVLFVPGTVEGIDARGVAVERDRAGAYHLPGPPRNVRYTVFTRPPWGEGRADPFVDAEPVSALPVLSPEVRALFENQVLAADDPDARMAAIAGWLQAEFRYTRAPRDADAEDPLERFLLERREGHCEYFASALAVGGRVVGVPTRVVNGFVGGEVDGDGVITVRRYNAHSWVEYFDGERWVTLDPTPAIGAPTGPGVTRRMQESVEALWESLVVDYDREAQVEVARTVGDAVVPFVPGASRTFAGGLLLGAVGGLAWLALRLGMRRLGRSGRRRVRDPVTAELERVLRAVEAGGIPLDEGPPVEVARRLAAGWPGVAAPLERLAWLSYEVRFGGADPAVRRDEAARLGRAVRDGVAASTGAT